MFISLAVCAVPGAAQQLISTGSATGLRLYSSGGNDYWLDPTTGDLYFRINGVARSTMSLQGALSVPNITASSGTFTATGNTQFSLQTTSGVNVMGGGVVASFLTGTHTGDGSRLTGITATTNANLTGPVTSVGNATTIVGPVPPVAVDLSTVTSALALKANLAGATFTGASGITNVAFTATGSGGNIISASSITTTGGLFGNGSGITNLAPGNLAAGTAGISVTGGAGTLDWEDNRTISPSELAANKAKFGFTSYANNNSSPYADFLHLRSYSDGSGGNDNLVMFRKDAIGMRIYQQAWGSGTAYASFKDMAFTDGTNASGTWSITTTGDAGSVDGIDGASIQRLDTSQNVNAGAVHTYYNTAGEVMNSISGNRSLTLFQSVVSSDAFMTFHIGGDYAGYLGLGGAENDLIWGGWSVGNNRHRVWHSGNDGSGSTLSADNVDGLDVHTGTNNEANKIVRTDGSGYIQAGWINSISGDNGTTAITRVTASNDQYLRYYTLANFASQVRGLSAWNNIAADYPVGQVLRWKNYGSSHVIFDASAGTSPSGSAVNNTVPDVAWTATYPNLMGWNGTNTYGVRVYQAQVATYAP